MTASKLTRTACTWADAEILYPGIEASWKEQSPGPIDVRVDILNLSNEEHGGVVVSELSYIRNNIRQWAVVYRCSDGKFRYPFTFWRCR